VDSTANDDDDSIIDDNDDDGDDDDHDHVGTRADEVEVIEVVEGE